MEGATRVSPCSHSRTRATVGYHIDKHLVALLVDYQWFHFVLDTGSRLAMPRSIMTSLVALPKPTVTAGVTV
jgi:hypothetical protein